LRQKLPWCHLQTWKDNQMFWANWQQPATKKLSFIYSNFRFNHVVEETVKELNIFMSENWEICAIFETSNCTIKTIFSLFDWGKIVWKTIMFSKMTKLSWKSKIKNISFSGNLDFPTQLILIISTTYCQTHILEHKI